MDTFYGPLNARINGVWLYKVRWKRYKTSREDPIFFMSPLEKLDLYRDNKMSIICKFIDFLLRCKSSPLSLKQLIDKTDQD